MKKAFIYSAIVLLAAATACNKTESVMSGDGQIRFALSAPETRSLVENVTDLQNNQTIKVFDFLDGTNYFDADETVSYSSGAWNFDSGKGYTWKTGSHRFFAYTSGAGSFADNILTVSKTLTIEEENQENQVDIVYSDIVTKTAEQAKADNYTPVRLNMDHLFAAVSFSLKNLTGGEVVVSSVSGPAIPNQGSATVNYSGDVPVVTYEAVNTSGSYVTAEAPAAGFTVASEGFVDVLNQKLFTKDDAPVYGVVWPQEIEKDVLSVTVKISDRDEVVVKLPAIKWVAGNKYDYVLQIYPTKIELTFKVMPWEKAESTTINTATGSINMSNVTWMNSKVYIGDVLTNTLVNSDYAVYMYKNVYLAVASTYEADVYDIYEEDVYQTYEEDVYDEDGETIIHHAGEQVLDEDNNPIVLHPAGEQVLDENGEPILLHKAGEAVLDENGKQVYEKGNLAPYTYFPAQGFFTVNYPSSGLFKITLIQAKYWNNPVPEGMYEIWIYDSTTKAFRKMNDAGETITNNTIYFQVRATANVKAPHDEYRARVNVLFKPTGSDEWISAESEVRADYACIISAETN